MHQRDIHTFDDLSEKYSTWIIKYCSTTFEPPLFLIWYTDTDENSTNRLLTYKSGEIVAVTSLKNLKATLLSVLDSMIVFDNLRGWLDNFHTLEVREYHTYDLVSVEKAIGKDHLDIPAIEGFAEFFNLYDDFIQQDERNAHLQTYADNELINETWDYYYDYIFWPRFTNKEKFEAWDRPPLLIDTKELLLRLKDMIKTFDDNLRLTYHSEQ